jgi:O-antigen ligase
MQMALMALMLLFLKFDRYKPLRWLFFGLAMAELVLSHSMTSVACFGLSALIIPFLLAARLPRKQRLLAYAASAVAIAFLAVLSVTFSAEVFRLLERDATLTGRTDVWRSLIVAIEHRPLLGYGFSSFWTGLRGESLDVIVASGWVVPEAHNGYLELELGLGPVGAILFVFSVFHFFRNGLEYLKTHRGNDALWPLVFMCYYLFHNLAESDLMNNGSFLGWSLFVAMSTSMALRRHRMHRVIEAPVQHPFQVEPAVLVYR